MLRLKPPKIEYTDTTSLKQISENYAEVGPNRLRKSESGLWELYLEGEAFERGLAFGKLAKNLLKYQEEVFVERILELIPSKSYLRFLRVFIGFFNRKLGKHIPDEFKREIYGISLSCTHEFNMIGTPFERQMHYHSAHDLGHALQDYMLVGCTSFATWGSASQNNSLIIGRNFDFYIGDSFAKHKIVAFYKPDKGYKFASVTWAGMTGVLSGINEKGLTVTINAAKSAIPTSSATPISVLVRQILQYASTINEAYEIALQHKTFVSESILVGSAIDGKAAIIEKSPKAIGLYETDDNKIICANHFQSKTFENDKKNLENIERSDSQYRQQRAQELIAENLPLTPQKTADILRNQQGLGGKNVGTGNEMTLNQLIGHHSVIFMPAEQLMWVSTSPWQLGEYIAYDLKEIFNNPDFSKEIKAEEHSIAADPFLQTEEYKNFIFFREERKKIQDCIKKKAAIHDEELLRFEQSNPEFYLTYATLGDYYASRKQAQKAIEYWQKALSKTLPTLDEKEGIEKKIKKFSKK